MLVLKSFDNLPVRSECSKPETLDKELRQRYLSTIPKHKLTYHKLSVTSSRSRELCVQCLDGLIVLLDFDLHVLRQIIEEHLDIRFRRILFWYIYIQVCNGRNR